MSKPTLYELQRWLAAHSILLHPSIELRPSSSGYSVFAACDLDPKTLSYSEFLEDDGGVRHVMAPQPLIRVPKQCVFSFRSLAIGHVFQDSGLEGLVALILAFLYELDLGPSSPWYTYLRTFDLSRDVPPPLWTESEKNWLKGSEAADSLDSSRVTNLVKTCLEFAAQAHQLGVNPPKVLSDLDEVSRVHAIGALALLLSSRAFTVDRYHGLALVPAADLFVRKTTANSHFESGYEVCVFCGKSGCGHGSVDDGLEDPDQDEEEDTEENLPVYLQNHRNQKGRIYALDCCDVILDEKVESGQELLLSFGECSNAILLCSFGCAELYNENDCVSVEEEFFSIAPLESSSQRLLWWQEKGYQLFQHYIQSSRGLDDEEMAVYIPGSWTEDLKVYYLRFLNTLLGVVKLLTMDDAIFQSLKDLEEEDVRYMGFFLEMDRCCYKLLWGLLERRLSRLAQKELYDVKGADEQYLQQLLDDPRVGVSEKRKLYASMVVAGEVEVLRTALDSLREAGLN